jgi:hypothetical protein
VTTFDTDFSDATAHYLTVIIVRYAAMTVPITVRVIRDEHPQPCLWNRRHTNIHRRPSLSRIPPSAFIPNQCQSLKCARASSPMYKQRATPHTRNPRPWLPVTISVKRDTSPASWRFAKHLRCDRPSRNHTRPKTRRIMLQVRIIVPDPCRSFFLTAGSSVHLFPSPG